MSIKHRTGKNNITLSSTGRVSFLILGLFLFFGIGLSVSGDEGMWLFNDPPRALVQERYQKELTPELLERLQKSSVRFGNGGSGSFVSSQGLVMTNHHVAAAFLQKLSQKNVNYLRDGFYARSPQEELPCPELELLMLLGMQDVSEQINKAVDEKETVEEAENARRAMMNQIEQEALNQLEKQGFPKESLKCTVISFYEGAQSHLYIYKRFGDVRLVFAPEQSVGFFGGDPDNFEYPRFCLDVAFFRVYENGQPYRPQFFLSWSPQGAAPGELVFVSGHPARTNRDNTVEHLIFQRDIYYPHKLGMLRRKEVLLQSYAERGEEEARRVASELFLVRNRRKSWSGILLGLQTPALMKQKSVQEEQLIKDLSDKKLIDMEKVNPWSYISEALTACSEIGVQYEMLEEGSALDSKCYDWAKSIVRHAIETAKPNAERLREFRESELKATRDQILAPVNCEPELEILKLADSLSAYLEELEVEYPTEDNPGLNLLNSQSPRERASTLVRGTRLADPRERERLLGLDLESLKKSDDTMIAFALNIEPYTRSLRTQYDQAVLEPMRQAYTAIKQAQSQLKGSMDYPDATFTLRLSFGQVAGYTDSQGGTLPPWTTFAGAFEHAERHQFLPPYDLPASWTQNRNRIALNTPLNILTTNDIVGGNSGSPLVNVRGEIVGLIFDGNIDSLVFNFIYTEERARAISVCSQAIVEGLNSIYHSERILQELGR